MQRSVFCDFCQKLAIFAVLNTYFLPFFCPSGACNLLNINKEKIFVLFLQRIEKIVFLLRRIKLQTSKKIKL